LEVGADLDPALAPFDPSDIEAQVGEVGDASGAVDDEVGLDRLAGSCSFEGDQVSAIARFDRCDGGGMAHVDPDLAAAVDQELDEVGVEALQRTLAAVDDDQ